MIPLRHTLPAKTVPVVNRALVAANVLVIEHPYKTLSQVKNLVSRFVRSRSELSDELKRNLAELASCA